jgi:hypothetical protein
MIDLWLDSGPIGTVILPFVAGFAIVAAIVWLTHLSPARPLFASCVGIAGPFFASVAVLFGLFAAFLANEVWANKGRADASISREADGVRTILRMAEAVGNTATPLRSAADAYVLMSARSWTRSGQPCGMAARRSRICQRCASLR